jgi:hypothetical protein
MHKKFQPANKKEYALIDVISEVMNAFGVETSIFKENTQASIFIGNPHEL